MSFIYFIRAGQTDWVKIGRAANVKSRMGNVQVGNHEELTLLAVIEGGRKQEHALHNVLRGVRRRGEWFECNHLVLLLLGLVGEGFTFDGLIASLSAYRETVKLSDAAKSKRGMIRKYRQGLVDPQNGRHLRRYLATRLPSLRQSYRDIEGAVEQSRDRLIETISEHATARACLKARA